MAAHIWVDADACPTVIREILYRAALRTGTPVVLIANHALRVPTSPLIRFKQVAAGFDEADNEIIAVVQHRDLVITSDIPLAAAVIDKGATALSPRGELYTADTIRDRLNMRDFLDTLRASGISTGGPGALNQGDRKVFANRLDCWLTQSINHSDRKRS